MTSTLSRNKLAAEIERQIAPYSHMKNTSLRYEIRLRPIEWLSVIEFLQPENDANEEYHALLGTLAALDVVIVSHDQPVIAAEIIRAAGAKKVMAAAKRSGYPFMPQLRKVYKGEHLDE